MDCISLPPRSLMNVLCEAYKSDEPLTTLRNLLEPYHITFEQLQSVIAEVFWPGRLSANESHPFYVVVNKMLEYQNVMSSLEKSDFFKKRFIYVATAVAHAWYSKKRDGSRYVLHKTPHFVTYQYPGHAVPYVWFSFDKFGMPHVFASHPWMPPLEITLHRSTSMGDMMPLTVRFFETNNHSIQAQSLCKLEFCVHDQHFLQLNTSPSNTRTFVMLISEDLLLSRCIMVSPTTDNAWSIPVVMHQYE